MKAIKQLSTPGLIRRRRHLMTMPLTSKRVEQVNRIDQLIREKEARP